MTATLDLAPTRGAALTGITVWAARSSQEPTTPRWKADLATGRFADLETALRASAIFIGMPSKIVVVAEGHFMGTHTFQFDPRYGLADFDTATLCYKGQPIEIVVITPAQAAAFGVANGVGSPHVQTISGSVDGSEPVSVAYCDFRSGMSVEGLSFTRGGGKLFLTRPHTIKGTVNEQAVGRPVMEHLVRSGLVAGCTTVSKLLSSTGLELLGSAPGVTHTVDVQILREKILDFLISRQMPQVNGVVVLDGVMVSEVQRAVVGRPKRGAVQVVTNHTELVAAGAAAYAATI